MYKNTVKWDKMTYCSYNCFYIRIYWDKYIIYHNFTNINLDNYTHFIILSLHSSYLHTKKAIRISTKLKQKMVK